MTEKERDEVFKRLAQNALDIYSGACNPSGVLRSMVEMADFGMRSHGNTSDAVRRSAQWAPFRLALAQLAFLGGMGDGDYEYTVWPVDEADESYTFNGFDDERYLEEAAGRATRCQ